MAQVNDSLEIEDVFPGYEKLRRETLIDSLVGLLSGFSSFPSAFQGSLARTGVSKEMIKQASSAIKAVRDKFPSMGVTFDGVMPSVEEAAMFGMKPKYVFTPRKVGNPLNSSTFTTETLTAEALESSLLRKLTEFGVAP